MNDWDEQIEGMDVKQCIRELIHEGPAVVDEDHGCK